MTTTKAATYAFRRWMTTWGAGLFVLVIIFSFNQARHLLGVYEVELYPVLSPVSICDGNVDKATGECLGTVVHYKSFEQTSSRCEGRDAMVGGYLSKVRADARYVQGRQLVFFGEPNGRFRRTAFELSDQMDSQTTNRPVGVQDWGEWRLIGGCVTEYKHWFTSVEHDPWHGLWVLPTLNGPFDLPPHETE